MVFCASLPPWPNAYAEADISCNRRDHVSTLRGNVRRHSQPITSITKPPSNMPTNGEIKMNDTVLSTPAEINDKIEKIENTIKIIEKKIDILLETNTK